MSGTKPVSKKRLLYHIHSDQLHDDNNNVKLQPDEIVGEETAEFHLSRIQRETKETLAPAIVNMQSLGDKISALKKQREETIRVAVVEWERDLIRQGKMERGKHVRATAEDKAILLARTTYYQDLDSLFGHMESITLMTRSLKSFSSTLEMELRELGLETTRTKIQTLLAIQQEPAIDMNFNDLEAIITCPTDKKRAKRAIALEENAANGKPVSAERKNKIMPKPKTKARPTAKRVKGAGPQAPKRVRKAQPVPAPQQQQEEEREEEQQQPQEVVAEEEVEIEEGEVNASLEENEEEPESEEVVQQEVEEEEEEEDLFNLWN